MARGPAVLIIDDDPAIRRLLRRDLSAAGYRVEDMGPGIDTLAHVAEPRFDVAILDIDLPAFGGPEIISAVREFSSIPILAVSSWEDNQAGVSALDRGADDWIRKPFDMREVLARIKNSLRRKAREQGKPVHLVSGALEVDLLHRRVRLDGQQVRLSAKPYDGVGQALHGPSAVFASGNTNAATPARSGPNAPALYPDGTARWLSLGYPKDPEHRGRRPDPNT
jgi:two-component system KDP operon response regulator KdpE